MLTRPMVAVIMVALLFCGATVGLEAVGLLFHASMPDPQQRIESYVARLEADLSPVDLPTEPVDVPSEVAEQTEREARLATAVVPAPDAVNTSEVPPEQGQAEPESASGARMTVAVSSAIAGSAPDTATSSDDLIAPRRVLSDPYSPAAHEPAADPAPLLAVQSSSPAPAETAAGDLLTPAPHDAAHEVAQETVQETAQETTQETAQAAASEPAAPLLVVQASSPPAAERPAQQRMAGAHRARPVRGPIGYAAFGWPVLDWLTTW